MNIKEKINLRDELDDEILVFFTEVCRYYLDNSPKWAAHGYKSKYHYSSYGYHHEKKDTLRIWVSTSRDDCARDRFDFSAGILAAEDWKPLVEQTFDVEREEIKANSEAARTMREAHEREQLKILQSKYGAEQ